MNEQLRLSVVARNSNGVFLTGPRSENDVRVPPFRRCSPPPRGFVNEAADFVNGEGGDCEVRSKFPNRTLKKALHEERLLRIVIVKCSG